MSKKAVKAPRGAKPSNYDASFPAKYSTGPKGRAFPSQLGKTQKAKGNPPKGGKK